MSGSELVDEFIGWLVISVVLFVIFLVGAMIFGKTPQSNNYWSVQDS